MKITGQHPPGAKCWLKDLYLRSYTTRASFNDTRTAIRGNRVVLGYLNNSDAVLLRPLTSVFRKVITVRETFRRNNATPTAMIVI